MDVRAYLKVSSESWKYDGYEKFCRQLQNLQILLLLGFQGNHANSTYSVKLKIWISSFNQPYFSHVRSVYNVMHIIWKQIWYPLIIMIVHCMDMHYMCNNSKKLAWTLKIWLKSCIKLKHFYKQVHVCICFNRFF